MSSVITARAAARVAVLLVGLFLVVTPSGASASASEIGYNTADAQFVKPGDLCKRGYTDYYWTMDDKFSGNESYMVLCGPSECSDCPGGWKPISVTMYLYWEERNSCQLTVQAEIRRAELGGANEPSPGELITTSAPTVVGPFAPAGLWAVTVALPRDCPTVAGPCFATLRFLDTCDERPAVVAGPAECESTSTWLDSGDGWVDLASCNFPGNPSVYATFECQIQDGNQPAAWSAIKDQYAE
jgi:hypothetical protein